MRPRSKAWRACACVSGPAAGLAWACTPVETSWPDRHTSNPKATTRLFIQLTPNNQLDRRLHTTAVPATDTASLVSPLDLHIQCPTLRGLREGSSYVLLPYPPVRGPFHRPGARVVVHAAQRAGRRPLPYAARRRGRLSRWRARGRL